MPAYIVELTEQESIPEALRRFARWCTWRLTPNQGGRPTKVPDQSTIDLAACRPWAGVAQTERWSEGGVGFVTTNGVACRLGAEETGRILLLDLDGCRNPVTEELAPWAVAWIVGLGEPYCEASPSGTGLRLVFAVADADLPKMRAKVQVAAPGIGGKKAEIQAFGLGPAGYVTITGHRLRGTQANVVRVEREALAALCEEYGLLGGHEEAGGSELPTGRGVAPAPEEITTAVAAMRNGEALRYAKWREVFPTKSASEAYSVLVGYALEAARGHGAAAVDWLLANTAWGKGLVDSADPDKYARRSWVEKDVARGAAKRHAKATAVFDALPEAPPAPEPAPSAAPLGDPLAIADEWEHDGPLVHMPTGIESLDELTGGGLVLGSRVYLAGAPDAGKTALMVQIADTYLARGVPVGLLCVDEEPGDVLTRLLQRRGFTREECEQRTPLTMAALRVAFEGLPLRLFPANTTIEEAAVALHRLATELAPGADRPPCALFVDSVQAAKSSADREDGSMYAMVTQRVAALRAAATRYRMLVVATSEMSRAAYRARKQEDQIADLASAKESGAIEYSARVMLTLRGAAGAPDVTEMRVAKNKHGPCTRQDQAGIFLRLNRATQVYVEDTTFEPLDAAEMERGEGLAQQAAEDAALVSEILFVGGAMTINGIVAAAKARGMPAARARQARALLAQMGAVADEEGPRGARIGRLVVEKLSPEVRKLFEVRLSSSSDQSQTGPMQ